MGKFPTYRSKGGEYLVYNDRSMLVLSTGEWLFSGDGDVLSPLSYTEICEGSWCNMEWVKVNNAPLENR